MKARAVDGEELSPFFKATVLMFDREEDTTNMTRLAQLHSLALTISITNMPVGRCDLEEPRTPRKGLLQAYLEPTTDQLPRFSGPVPASRVQE